MIRTLAGTVKQSRSVARGAPVRVRAPVAGRRRTSINRRAHTRAVGVRPNLVADRAVPALPHGRAVLPRALRRIVETSRFRAKRPMVGLDIGSSGLKAVQLTPA